LGELQRGAGYRSSVWGLLAPETGDWQPALALGCIF
jgi:hypothetical protein